MPAKYASATRHLIDKGSVGSNGVMTSKPPNLSKAYSLSSPEDSKRLYADWAESYDQDFVGEQGYILHLQVARHFVASGGQGPVLDVGAGTGVCGAALRELGISEIEATDISADMLKVAAAKDVYRSLFTADLLQGLPVADNSYGGIVSSGTFTTGHVGPQAIDELARVVKPGGLIALSINAKHFGSAGFAAKFETLNGSIYDLSLTNVRIYEATTKGEHKDDQAFVAQFRKA